MNALLLSPVIRSFPELSLCPTFRRQWMSACGAIRKGRQDQDWLERYFIRLVPTIGSQVFSLDGTAWPHPQAKVTEDLQYVHSPTSAIDGGNIVIGHPYSVLAREFVIDNPLPWQPAQEELTPERVQHGLGGLFQQISTPAAPPKARGKSPGWPKGQPRTRRQRHQVVKKTKKKAKAA